MILPKDSAFRVVRLKTIPAVYSEASVPLGISGALSQGFDALLLQEDYPPFCQIFGALARRENIPYIVSCERYGYFFKMPMAAMNRAQDLTFNRILWKNARAMTFHSRASALFLSSLGAPVERMYFTPTPTDSEVFTPKSPEPNRAQSSEVRIVCIARLVPAKGLFVLLDSVKILADGGLRGFTVHLQGRGPLAKSIQQHIQSHGLDGIVRLYDSAISLPHLPDFYRAADIYVQPSLNEPAPNACREAMACGLPVVASLTGGLADVVTEGITGFLVAPGDAKGLASALATLIRDPHRRAEFGKTARLKVEREMDLNVVASLYERIILGLVAEHDSANISISH